MNSFVGRASYRMLTVTAVSLFLAVSSPAQAYIPLVSTPLAISHTAFWVSGSGTCYLLAYDKNGNRVSQSSTAITNSPATWGATQYGCAVWSL